ncbi:hypothetical protein A3Q56_07410 [Intoshia linei]|uniref:G-protein coupled receptors family 1 profile domain-containing protein n=1 Tax=Intoshia linei TaxID=1819745 RepID=A0A177AS84_9BILA|nr:hypothetical protein A3Q56_07410 [Intoshia linei]
MVSDIGSEIILYMWKILIPVILIFGIPGNVLTMIITVRPAFLKYKASVILFLLALFDLLTLIFETIPEYIEIVHDYEIKGTSTHLCKASKVVHITFSDTAIAILCFYTIERTYTVIKLNHKLFEKRKSYILAILTLLTLAFLKNIPFLWTRGYEVRKDKSIDYCGYTTPSRRDYELIIRPYIALGLITILPVIILAVGNGLIVYHLRKHKKNMVHLFKTNTISPNMYKEERSPSSDNTAIIISTPKPLKSKKNNDITVKFNELTKMCIFVSIIFIILVSPSMILLFFKRSYGTTVVYKVTKSIFDIFRPINHSVNFIVYVASGKKFKKEIRVMFCKRMYIQPNTKTSKSPYPTSNNKYINDKSAEPIYKVSNKYATKKPIAIIIVNDIKVEDSLYVSDHRISLNTIRNSKIFSSLKLLKKSKNLNLQRSKSVDENKMSAFNNSDDNFNFQ